MMEQTLPLSLYLCNVISADATENASSISTAVNPVLVAGVVAATVVVFVLITVVVVVILKRCRRRLSNRFDRYSRPYFTCLTCYTISSTLTTAQIIQVSQTIHQCTTIPTSSGLLLVKNHGNHALIPVFPAA